jgi:hypothetical protein
MKLSELIKLAQEAYEQHGDLRVVDSDYMPLDFINKTTLVTKKGIKKLVFMSFFKKGIQLKDL